MKVFQENWGFQVYAEGLMVVKDLRNLFWKKPESKQGAVPRLPKPALTAHYLIHSRQYLEQG